MDLSTSRIERFSRIQKAFRDFEDSWKNETYLANSRNFQDDLIKSLIKVLLEI